MIKKYESVTTPGLYHDASNAITELIVLNRDLLTEEYPWRKGKPHQQLWTKTVGIIRKLLKPPYALTPDQLAFYVHRCRPKEIDSSEFAKMAVVARKLLLKMDLEQLMFTYRRRREQLELNVTANIQYQCKVVDGPKTLVELIREIEANGTKV